MQNSKKINKPENRDVKLDLLFEKLKQGSFIIGYLIFNNSDWVLLSY